MKIPAERENLKTIVINKIIVGLLVHENRVTLILHTALMILKAFLK